jgi:hypothetical protein
MRRTLLAIAATVAVVSAGSLTTNHAEAMTLGTPAGLRSVIEDSGLAEQVAYTCRNVWRCGSYGCGWRRACYGRPGGYYRPYRYY